uniref:Cytochrome P450 n=1 Tax=Rhabditophanes sp. KR3021 TaxID=114890 RepID=A0AC35UGJ3_9BILA
MAGQLRINLIRLLSSKYTGAGIQKYSEFLKAKQIRIEEAKNVENPLNYTIFGNQRKPKKDVFFYSDRSSGTGYSDYSSTIHHDRPYIWPPLRKLYKWNFAFAGLGMAICIFNADYYYVYQRKRFLKLRDRMNLKGPPLDFFTGNILDRMKYEKRHGKENMINYSIENFERYGSTYATVGGSYFMVFTKDIDMIKEVFVKQFDKFVDRSSIKFTAGFPLGKSLLQVGQNPHNGVEWKRLRATISPTFTNAKLKEMFPIVVERCKAFTKAINKRIETNKLLKITEEFHAVTMDVIGRVAFATPTNCIDNRNEPFYTNGRNFLKELEIPHNKPMTLSLIFPFLTPLLLPFSPMKQYERPLAKRLYEVVRERREKYEDFKDHKDLIQLLLKSDKENIENTNLAPMSDDVIVSNCFGFLLAGFETTSNLLTFSSYYLAKHQDIQERLYNEINEAFEDKNFDYDVIMKLPYLDAIFKETLRLRPSAAQFVSRTATQDCEILGIKFEKGTSVIAPIFVIHWDEQYWPDAHSFNPERFIINPKPSSDIYFPFGIGPRICVGARFAAMEYKLTLVELIKNFTLSIDPVATPDPLPIYIAATILRPIKPVELIVNRRL